MIFIKLGPVVYVGVCTKSYSTKHSNWNETRSTRAAEAPHSGINVEIMAGFVMRRRHP